MFVVFKRKINPPPLSCRVSTPLQLIRYSWKIRLMERKALQFFLIFFCLCMFLNNHVHTRAYSILFAKTNGSSGTYSASMHFPNHHICRKKKKSVEFLYPSLVSGLYKAVFYTAQIVQMHHLSQSWVGWSVGDTERECFTEWRTSGKGLEMEKQPWWTVLL